MGLNTIQWNINVFILKTMKIVWFSIQSYEISMILCEVWWFGYGSQYESTNNQWISIKINEQFMILHTIQWNINVFLWKNMKIVWFSIHSYEISMILYQSRWFCYESQYKSTKHKLISIKIDENINVFFFNKIKYRCSAVLNSNQRTINTFLSKSIKI